MPAFANQARLIDDQTQLNEWCERLVGQSVIALDTEFMRTDSYYPKLCLIQMAINDDLACIDVLAEIDTEKLRKILVNQPTPKIFHAAKQDLEACYASYGHLLQPIVDTQIAAGLLGYPAQIGYASLVQEMLGISLDKGQTRTDWSRRPLTDAQIKYAGDDVRYLAELHTKLRTALQTAGRYDWALEDSAQLVDVEHYVFRPEDAWRRLSGLQFLPAPVQARAHGIAAWRERRAQRINRPRQWVLTDKGLMALANADPRDENGLSDLQGLPPGVIRKQGRSLLKELSLANEDFSSGRVQLRQASKSEAPNPRILKRLSAIVSAKATELGIVPETLGTRRDLTALMRGERNIKLLTGWRSGIIGAELLGHLEVQIR
jgi:ribonuclease D